MNFNKYNTRNSGRFNTPGTFVPPSELSAGPMDNYDDNMDQQKTLQTNQNNKTAAPTAMQEQDYKPPLPISSPAAEAADEPDAEADDAASKPPWMRAKLQGVKKISNKERRRRQNENLRRLLTPKSALMVLNEIVPGEPMAQQFRVEAMGAGAGAGVVVGTQFGRPTASSYCAEITVKGNTYKGYGDSRVTARNAAAEQAVRDLILGRMARSLQAEPADGEPGEADAAEEEPLPMIQMASFALHKLFAEWECDGHRVPHLRSPNPSVAEEEGVEEIAPGPKRRKLPEHAAAMHPCMLLTYMRPQLEYRELAVTGDRPQNMYFTMGIDVDGTTFTGRACNKKEARKAAARAACIALFGVQFDSLH